METRQRWASLLGDSVCLCCQRRSRWLSVLYASSFVVDSQRKTEAKSNSGSMANSTNSTRKHHVKPYVPEWYYIYTVGGPRLCSSAISYGLPPKPRKGKSSVRGAYNGDVLPEESEHPFNSTPRTSTADHMQRRQKPMSPRNRPAYRPAERPRTGHNKQRPLTAKFTWDIHGRRVPSDKIKAFDDSYLLSGPRKSYLTRPTSTKPAQQKAVKTSWGPDPSSPRPPSSSAAAQRRRQSPRPKQGSVITVPSEQSDDEETNESKDEREAEYQVHVRTGNCAGASTTAAVHLTIYGENGHTPPCHLATSKYNKVKFQRGKEDLFVVKTRRVGKITKIKIGHDRQELSYAWYLDSLSVRDVGDSQVYQFPCNKWLSGQEEGGHTYCTFIVNPAHDSQNSDTDTRLNIQLTDPEPKPTSRNKSAEPRREQSAGKSAAWMNNYMRSKRDRRVRIQTQGKDSDTRGAPESDSYPKAGKNERESNTRERSESDYRPNSKKNETESNVRGKSESEKRPKSSKNGRESNRVRISESETQSKTNSSEETSADPDERGTDRKPQPVDQDFLAGYKAGIEASEASERQQKEEERQKLQQLLSGPSIHDACRKGDLERVDVLLQNFPEMKDLTDENGWTPMHLAASLGEVDVMKKLISAGCKNLDLETPTGYTATHLAAMHGFHNAVLVLNIMGASIDCRTVDKQTPLHLASSAGHIECVKCLVANKASLTAEDAFSRTAYDLADQYGQNDVADFLHSCLLDLNNPSSTFAQMHLSQKSGDADAVEKNNKKSRQSANGYKTRPMSSQQKNKAKEEKELQAKRELYQEQHRHMEEEGLSFLDSIRQDLD